MREVRSTPNHFSTSHHLYCSLHKTFPRIWRDSTQAWLKSTARATGLASLALGLAKKQHFRSMLGSPYAQAQEKRPRGMALGICDRILQRLRKFKNWTFKKNRACSSDFLHCPQPSYLNFLDNSLRWLAIAALHVLRRAFSRFFFLSRRPRVPHNQKEPREQSANNDVGAEDCDVDTFACGIDAEEVQDAVAVRERAECFGSCLHAAIETTTIFPNDDVDLMEKILERSKRLDPPEEDWHVLRWDEEARKKASLETL